MILDIIIPVFNKEKNILNTYNKINEELSNIKHNFIFIDNNSSDKSFDILKDIYNKDDSNVKIIRLSKTCNIETCIYVGIKHSKHDLVCIYNYFNPSNILKMYNYLEKNNDIDSVCLYSNNKKSVKEKFLNLFLTIKYDSNKTLNRMFRRTVCNAIIEYSKDNMFTNYTFDLIGFKTEYIDFENKNSICNFNLIYYSDKIINLFKYSSYILFTLSFIYLIFILFDLIHISNEVILLIILLFTPLNLLVLYFNTKYNLKIKNEYYIKDKIGFDENFL